MKTLRTRALALVIAVAAVASSSTARAQTSAFTYQGQLSSGPGAANGSFDLKFSVYDANVAGNFIAGPITNSAVAVSNGLFTVTLDFGHGVFTGTNYWVEMSVRTNGVGAFATLVPRQQLTPAPYAISLVSPQATALCPPGSVMAYMGATAPNGWLLCDGSTVSRTNFAALFSVIGANCGAGNGTTTFNLPDFRGRFLRGVDSGIGRDPDASSRFAMNTGGNSGNSVGSLQTDTFLDHTHGAGSLRAAIEHSGGALHSREGSPGFSMTTSISIAGQVASGSVAESVEVFGSSGNQNGSTTNSGHAETRPINAYVNYIIKY